MEKPTETRLKLYVVDMDFLSIYAKRAFIEKEPKVKLVDGDGKLQTVKRGADKIFRNRPPVQV